MTKNAIRLAGKDCVLYRHKRQKKCFLTHSRSTPKTSTSSYKIESLSCSTLISNPKHRLRSMPCWLNNEKIEYLLGNYLKMMMKTQFEASEAKNQHMKPRKASDKEEAFGEGNKNRGALRKSWKRTEKSIQSHRSLWCFGRLLFSASNCDDTPTRMRQWKWNHRLRPRTISS